MHQKQNHQHPKNKEMTKVITFMTVALFSIGITAQETKPAAKKEKAKKESCCTKTDAAKKDKKACCVKK